LNSAALLPLQHLAALRWLLLSPPLVVAPDASTQLAVFSAADRDMIADWLTSLEHDDSLLTEWISSRSEVRIGRYAESLLAFYLTHGPLHRLTAAHVPIRSEINGLKITHGELDYLLTHANGQRLHWELAVKFFLCTGTDDIATPLDFLGPNGVETLAQKWHKLFAKQLKHVPPEPWNSHTWQPQAFTRGWMFYRWGSAVPSCEALHVDHCKAWWIDWVDMAQLPQGRYSHLARLHWMAPVHSIAQLGAGAQMYTLEAMADHLQTLWGTTQRSTDAQMLVLWSEDGRELYRYFVRPSAKLLG
jgi:uncharacterized protein